MKLLLSLLFFSTITLVFFYAIFSNKLPIPSDTIVGLYHPYRDAYAKEYPNGIPFKNFLVTDPVRQQYPWKELSIALLKEKQLPLWNPYSFSGTPLLANIQSGVFYPFNVLFLSTNFSYSWTLFIMIQLLFTGIFFFLYAQNLGLRSSAVIIGTLAWMLSGFSIAWLEWGTVLHAALWLPLLLLAIDKLFSATNKKLLWSVVVTLSCAFSFFAGHLQTSFYIISFSLLYSLLKWRGSKKLTKSLWCYIASMVVFLGLILVQLIPSLQFILLSGREADQALWQKEGWFIPWQHLLQFIAPDFFGNPTTLNYWGLWNYAEFIGYVGILPLFFAIYAVLKRREKKTYLYTCLLVVSLLFALPTFFAKIPFLLKLPFIATAQPTRLLVLTDFSLAILATLGVDYLFQKKKAVTSVVIVFLCLFIGTWAFLLFNNGAIEAMHISTAKRNMLFPTILFFSTTAASLCFLYWKRIPLYLVVATFIGITCIDLFRFGWKFTSFSSAEYLYPSTKTIAFIKQNIGNHRIMATDSRIFPPNFSVLHRIPSIEGYDPLYIRTYGEFIAAVERDGPNISPPFGFNRIITPRSYTSEFMSLLGVKYVLSFDDISSSQFKKVLEEGKTKVYENTTVLPKTFFVKTVSRVSSKEQAIKQLFQHKKDLAMFAVVEENMTIHFPEFSVGSARITKYSENDITIITENKADGFLVLSDVYYPTWDVTVDGEKKKLFKTDYAFRGVLVPKGRHTVKFSVHLL